MKKAIQFKALQRQTKFRNPNCLLDIPEDFHLSKLQLVDAERYLDQLHEKDIRYTYPQDENYPSAFYFMKEPPLFLEYIGEPAWMTSPALAVVGARECHPLTRDWILSELVDFLDLTRAMVVSGGARGVDQYCHLAAVKAGLPTVVVLPSGLLQLYPNDLYDLKNEILRVKGCFLTEFEMNQKIHKSFFYFRNRLISALGKGCLVAQSTLKSGTMLTVHHALENGRQILTIPSHPGLAQFSGNIKLMKDGAIPVYDASDLLQFWLSESWSGSDNFTCSGISSRKA